MAREKDTVKKHLLEKPEFWANLALGLVFMIIIGGFGLFLFDIAYLLPIRANTAQEECLAQGFDIHTSFKGFLRHHPLGVKCDYVDFERVEKNIQIDSETATAHTLVIG